MTKALPSKKEHGWFRIDTRGDERVVSVWGESTIQEAMSVCMYVYLALLTFAGAFCERSCVVLLHLLFLFKLSPFYFFHHDALNAQLSIITRASSNDAIHRNLVVARCVVPCQRRMGRIHYY